MGVDYTSHYGIGFQIKYIDFESENKSSINTEHECLEEYLDEELDSELFSWFKVGEGSYTGEQDEYYVTINSPFESGINGLEYKETILRLGLKGLKLEPIGSFGSIGGLEVS